jgi:hypothetical protein
MPAAVERCCRAFGGGEGGCVHIGLVRRCADLPGEPLLWGSGSPWEVHLRRRDGGWREVVGGSISQGCALGYIPAPRLRLNFWGAFWGDEGGAPSELFWVVRFYFSALTDRANRMAPRRGWWWRGRRSSGLVVGGGTPVGHMRGGWDMGQKRVGPVRGADRPDRACGMFVFSSGRNGPERSSWVTPVSPGVPAWEGRTPERCRNCSGGFRG